MINPQSHFLLLNNKNQYDYSLNFSNSSDLYSAYGLITKGKYHNISLLFYITSKHSKHNNILCPILFTAYRAINLYKLIELHRVVIMQVSPGHAFYLGTELMKAELSLIIDHNYIQN